MSVALTDQYFSRKKFINHDIMNCTAEGVEGNHLYSGRALGLSHESDIIQITPELQPLWQDIVGHYQRIGLEHSHQVIWNVDLPEVVKHCEYEYTVFYFGAQECSNWGDYDWMEAVEYINSKNNFIDLAEKLQLDVPQTLCFDNVNAMTDEVINTLVFPCYLKAAISVSGVGIYRCQDVAALKEGMAQFDPEVPVQVQEEIIADTFLNVQFQAEGNKAKRLAISEQVLDGFVHQGNRYPARCEPWESVQPMADWLVKKGIKGIFAFDVAVAQTDKGTRFPAIECNPRYNGASYPTMIAKKLGINTWITKTYSTQHRELSSLDLSGLEYDAKTGEGIVLVNWGSVLVGKLMVLLAGSPAYQEKLEVELKKRL